VLARRNAVSAIKGYVQVREDSHHETSKYHRRYSPDLAYIGRTPAEPAGSVEADRNRN
jgi:hypothetical protein